ncbi:Spo0E family sporulation regulatory protein-aspartic acid phosphatase [Fonticella tunisiensis]|uniref:Spo0E like sporulation regulatory protein n=1 Tax=Fonticella tunisiensis TaxID=1096341 RepID=A0A4R7KV67_9CLOT|nr:Spo0E family sporulation regulatory protein-aspartic acid phosphatase [Fonticella tunisiensis]TDT63654.1 Spo0E like sporulation regulatory protein [Fonticella tunisiensis]
MEQEMQRLSREKTLERIHFLRKRLEKIFIKNDMKINTQIILLSKELDRAIINYHKL